MSLRLKFVFSMALVIHMTQSTPTFQTMKDFDAEKFGQKSWWVTFRGERLLKGKLDRCLTITLVQPSDKLYLEIAHENSGSIDEAYYPATINEEGFKFDLQGEDNVTVQMIYTDYDSFAIGYMTIEKRNKEFLVLYANKPKPEGELLEKMAAKLKEIVGVDLDAVEPVDNDDCPEKAKP